MAKPEKSRHKMRLGEIFLQQGLLTEEQLEAALSEQKRSGGKLGRVCIDSGYLNEDQVSVALARQLQVPFVDLKHVDVKPDLVMLLAETLARRFRAIVLEETDSDYAVGFADPTDLFAFDEITRILKRDVRLAVVSESLLLQTIDRTYRRTEEIRGLALALGAEHGASVIALGGVGLPGQSARLCEVVGVAQRLGRTSIDLRRIYHGAESPGAVLLGAIDRLPGHLESLAAGAFIPLVLQGMAVAGTPAPVAKARRHHRAHAARGQGVEPAVIGKR